MRFSQRYGYKPVRKIIQKDSIDEDLRNRLWNALTIYYWNEMRRLFYESKQGRAFIKNFLFKIWHDHFKKPIDNIKTHWRENLEYLKYHYFNCQWYEVYDFIEFIVNEYPNDNIKYNFIKFSNSVLEKELSGWRFVGDIFTPITSEDEITTVEDALKISASFKPINIHLRTSLEKLSDRKSPDYRNSIKESISAVEAICNLITKSPKRTLGQCIKGLEAKLDMHPALKDAFSKLYGYTSDAEGIRHALMDEPNLEFEDAKFMLVACSAFINYLILKSSKAGISF
jgi:hypothetical protein